MQRCLGSVGLAEVVLSADRLWGSVPGHRLQKPNVPRKRPHCSSMHWLPQALVDSGDVLILLDKEGLRSKHVCMSASNVQRQL